jgi:hypothetical protein
MTPQQIKNKYFKIFFKKNIPHDLQVNNQRQYDFNTYNYFCLILIIFSTLRFHRCLKLAVRRICEAKRSKILRKTKYRKSVVLLKGFKISAEMKKHKSEVESKGFKI